MPNDNQDPNAAQDDRHFFAAAVERSMDRLYGTALRLTRNPTDAEDLVADTLTKAWRGLATLQDRQSFEKWLFRILVNTFISDRRRQSARPAEVPAEQTQDGETFSLFDKVHQPFLLWWGNPEQRLLDRLMRDDIEKALTALPEAYRLVVIIIEVWGLSYAEAAEMLDLPIGTVRSRLNRGRSQLQRTLWRQAQQLGITPGRQRPTAEKEPKA